MSVFLDEAKINVTSGNGGNGIATFHHLKSGGKKIASGGSGGKGGDVILRASGNVTTLYGFKKKVHFKAENGKAGGNNNKTGRDGNDIVIPVPVGTIIRDDANNMLADLSREGDEIIVARGGMGGRGNASFTSQKRRFPSFSEKGEETGQSWINLELRLLADAALVGFPNSGKSTMISRISAARPKIADYPFTTLVPHLGVVALDDEDFVVADIPGLIKGAHEGVGLGHRFLRHITRSPVLVMVLDGQVLLGPEGEKKLLDSCDTLRKEIRLYDLDAYGKEFMIVINKIDLITERDVLDRLSKKLGKGERDVMLVSAATGEGMEDFTRSLYERIKAVRENAEPDGKKSPDDKEKLYTVPLKEIEERKIQIEETPEGYIVRNRQLERMVAMTDLENEEALDYLMHRLKKMKVGDRLKSLGIDEGSTVIIGKLVFDMVE